EAQLPGPAQEGMAQYDFIEGARGELGRQVPVVGERGVPQLRIDVATQILCGDAGTVDIGYDVGFHLAGVATGKRCQSDQHAYRNDAQEKDQQVLLHRLAVSSKEPIHKCSCNATKVWESGFREEGSKTCL